MLAYHAIISAYGFWLPNDPRGSWSTYVGNRELHAFAGDATKVATTRSVAGREHDASKRQAAKALLKHPPVRFHGEQARSIASGFRDTAEQSGHTLLALAIMPTHTHLVIAATGRRPAQVVGHLKRGATIRLIDDGLHPNLIDGQITHPCWGKQSWSVFLDTESDVRRAIRYVENNPVKDGLRMQRWEFVLRWREKFFATRSARQAGRLMHKAPDKR